MNLALCQFEDQPAVNCTEAQFAVLRSLPNAFHIVQDPAQLGAGEIRIEYQTCLVICLIRNVRIFGDQFILHISCPAALPDDGPIDRLTGGSVPDNGRFTLVGNADRRDVFIRRADFLHCLTGRGELCLPDFTGVMFHPAGLRIKLCEFFLHHRAHFTLFIEKNASAAGCSRIQRHYIFCHF